MGYSYINFNKLLDQNFGFRNGYVRKVLSIKPNRNSTYGLISKSIYYTEEKCDRVECRNGDYFIICDNIKNPRDHGTIGIYYLVVFEKKANTYRILNTVCRASNNLDHRDPENIFVNYLMHNTRIPIEIEE